MNWRQELELYLSGKVPTDERELETLLQELAISQFNIAETKFGKTGINTYEAQRRIREMLTYRWGIRFAVGSAIVSVLGAIVSWARVIDG